MQFFGRLLVLVVSIPRDMDLDLRIFVQRHQGKPVEHVLEAAKVGTLKALAALHPHMAEVFRQKATTLAAGLEHDEQRDAARQALRGFLDKIVIPPGDGLLQVVGNFGSMLAAAQGRIQPGTSAVGYVGCGGGI